MKDLQETQKAIDTTQEAVKTTSEEYKKFLETQPPFPPAVEDESGAKTNLEHLLEVMHKVGLMPTDDQKDQITKMMSESDIKRRKLEKQHG